MFALDTVGAAAAGKWLPVDAHKIPPSIGLGVTLSSDGNLTYKVQHTLDTLRPLKTCKLTRAATVATVVFLADHGLTVNDSVVVSGSGDPNLDGTFDVASVVDSKTITYTVANTGATAAQAGVNVLPLRVFDHGSLSGNTTAASGSYDMPVTAVRLRVTVYAAGKATLAVRQGARS